MGNVKYDKIKKLAMENSKTWKQDFIALLGGKKGYKGELTLESSHKEFDAKDLDFQKITHMFLDGDVDKLDALTMESGGSAQNPSQFSDVNAWSSTVGGLLDMLALDAFSSAPLIGKNLVERIPRKVRGGKMSRVYTNQKSIRNIGIGEPAPTANTLQEGWVELPYPNRYAQRIKLIKEDFTFDRTGTIQQAVEDLALTMAVAEEEDILTVFAGIYNSYVRDGVGLKGSNTDAAQPTYLTSANTSTVVNGNLPFNYVNSATATPLTTAQSLANGEVLLRSNRDPYSNIPIDLGDHPTLVVSPYNEPVVSQILWSIANMRYNVSETQGADNTTYGVTVPEYNRTYPNKFQVNGKTVDIGKYRLTSSWLLYSMLTTGKFSDGSQIYTEAGVKMSNMSATDAQAAWWLLSDKAFGWAEIYPFSSVDTMIDGDDASANVVVSKYLQNYGVPFVKEPRYAGKFGN